MMTLLVITGKVSHCATGRFQVAISSQSQSGGAQRLVEIKVLLHITRQALCFNFPEILQGVLISAFDHVRFRRLQRPGFAFVVDKDNVLYLNLFVDTT
jgi:hypothetical protein